MHAARTARSLAAIAIAACSSGSSAPFDVTSGRLTARIWPSRPQIELLVDGDQVWTTVAGTIAASGSAPYAFAAVGTLDVTVDAEFGSYKFTENTAAEHWQVVDHLADVTATADGATFTMWAGSQPLGTGTLTLISSTRAGPDPGAAGFPGQVRIDLVASTGARVALAAPCSDGEHFVGLGGMSWDVDHRGFTVPLWVQEDGIGKLPTADDDYTGVWFLIGRRHSTHTPMPMMLSSDGYALAVDTSARAVFELGSVVPDATRYEVWDTTLDLQIFVGAGATPSRDALATMSEWVGKPATPDPVVFSPWIDAIHGSTSVRQVASALRSNGIPSSVIWTEDWRGATAAPPAYVLEENWHVDRTLYPDFEQLGADLRAEGFAFLTYNNTFIDSSGDVYPDATAQGYPIHAASGGVETFEGNIFDPTTVLDLTNPAAVAWAQAIMALGETDAADGWMADFGEWQPTDATSPRSRTR
jgi:alpha-glucosidase (family GH31 glycosyl hydrolase)